MKILLLGSYGGGNIGDELISYAISNQLISEFPGSRISAFTFNEKVSCKMCDKVTWYEYKNFPLTYNWFIEIFRKILESMARFDFFSMVLENLSLFMFPLTHEWNIIKDADLVLVGGGGMFYDYSMFAIVGWINRIGVLRLLGKRYNIIANSFTNFKTRKGEKIFKYILRGAKSISVRDIISKDICIKQVGITPQMVMDPVFLIPGQINISSTITDIKQSKTIMLVPRPWPMSDKYGNIDKWIEVVNWLNQKFPKYRVKIFPMYKGNDYRFCREICRKAKNACEVVLVNPWRVKEIYDIFCNASAVIGMRLHSIIIAKSCGVPVVGISYDPKVAGLFKNDNTTQWCIDFEEFIKADSVIKITDRLSSLLREKIHINIKKLILSDYIKNQVNLN